MSLYKICKPIDYEANEWKDYCAWRNRVFTEFRSLDSTIQNSVFEPTEDSDWDFLVYTDEYLTDVVNDLNFARSYAERMDAQVILSFDFIENAENDREVVGYDILDGALSFSLLTNFGNDISIVNKHLDTSGLIPVKSTAIAVHEWFLSKMPQGSHVIGSKICSVYPRMKIEDLTALIKLDPDATFINNNLCLLGQQ